MSNVIQRTIDGLAAVADYPFKYRDWLLEHADAETVTALLDAVQALGAYRMNINSSKSAMLGRAADEAIERVEALLSSKGGRG